MVSKPSNSLSSDHSILPATPVPSELCTSHTDHRENDRSNISMNFSGKSVRTELCILIHRFPFPDLEPGCLAGLESSCAWTGTGTTSILVRHVGPLLPRDVHLFLEVSLSGELMF